MFPFERYMKKLKGYVRNKVKPEGSIAEGYVAEEALTFSSHYFDPATPTCHFQVFRSVCKSIGLRSVIRFDAQELKKVKWYVLHNSPEIDTYRSQFKRLFPNKDMKEEFPEWFGSQLRPNPTDGQSTVVDVPPDIIDVPDEDNDIIDDEDAFPHDLADSDVEDLINVDDDGVEKIVVSDVAGSQGGDGGGDDRFPPSHVVPTGCGGCFANKGRTWNPPAGQRSTKASTCTCKKLTIPTRLLSRPSIRRQTPPSEGSRSAGCLRDEIGRPQTLRSTLHSLTPSGEHTLLTVEGDEIRLEHVRVSTRRMRSMRWQEGRAVGVWWRGEWRDSDGEDVDDDGER
ncbi:DIE2/ALG10 family protein [Tanacetum coccineum]